MKILFIYPNDYLSIGIPTGIATLSSCLKKAEFDVGLFDFTFIKTKELEPRPDKGEFLPTAYTMDDLVRDDPVTTLELAFAEKLRMFRPDLVAVSTMTGHFDRVVDLLRAVKPDCPVVIGGVHATIYPEDVLNFDEIDYVCVGDGEEMVVELCESLRDKKDILKIKNLGYRKDGKIIINELRPFSDFDNLPYPDWELFDSRHLFRPFMGEIYQGSFYVMSRGCPQQCTYCVNGSLRKVMKDCGRYFRFQSPATTISQIAYLKEKFNATWFKFADDSIMLFSEQYLEELAEGLEPLKIKFGCSVRPETVTENKVKLLKRMGCVAASVGVESGNEQLRKEILNRRMTNDQIKNAIRLLNAQGIRVSTFNMLGLPNETRENVFDTIRLNKELKLEAVNVYIIYPYPGTDIFIKHGIKMRGEDGKIIPVANASSFAFSKMDPSEVEGLLKTFRLYLVLPEEIWPIVRIAEGTDETAGLLFDALNQYASKLN